MAPQRRRNPKAPQVVDPIKEPATLGGTVAIAALGESKAHHDRHCPSLLGSLIVLAPVCQLRLCYFPDLLAASGAALLSSSL